jgi:hypothetical protein
MKRVDKSIKHIQVLTANLCVSCKTWTRHYHADNRFCNIFNCPVEISRGSCSTKHSPYKRRPCHWLSKLKANLPYVVLLLGALDAEQLVEAGASRGSFLGRIGLRLFVGLGRADHLEVAPACEWRSSDASATHSGASCKNKKLERERGN